MVMDIHEICQKRLHQNAIDTFLGQIYSQMSIKITTILNYIVLTIIYV